MPRKIIKTPRQVGRWSGESASNHRQAHAALLALANPNEAKFWLAFSKLGKVVFGDEHYLMHTACAWMLREVGKRNQSMLKDFLRQPLEAMPRTMLRYAIERFCPARRTGYLTGKIR